MYAALCLRHPNAIETTNQLLTSRFQHIITGAKSPYAKECAGGVVADEMGLGKSLTMLSAITGSLASALNYARAVTSINDSGRGIIAAKSTVIVVPSARTLISGALGSPLLTGISSNRWLD
jgi:hypothetical protein